MSRSARGRPVVDHSVAVVVDAVAQFGDRGAWGAGLEDSVEALWDRSRTGSGSAAQDSEASIVHDSVAIVVEPIAHLHRTATSTVVALFVKVARVAARTAVALVHGEIVTCHVRRAVGVSSCANAAADSCLAHESFAAWGCSRLASEVFWVSRTDLTPHEGVADELFVGVAGDGVDTIDLTVGEVIRAGEEEDSSFDVLNEHDSTVS